jgi:hypothetical protein
LKPEEKAREKIDQLLEAAGWAIQDYIIGYCINNVTGLEQYRLTKLHFSGTSRCIINAAIHNLG